MAPTREVEKIKFRSPEGIDLCRKILIERLPFCPHDYQLEGVTSILDGIDTLALSATGSGKTGYIYMTLHVILAVQQDPLLKCHVTFPANPAIIVVSPTNALEENQAAKINRFGLKAKAVNGVTKDEAQRRGINIWEDVEAECSVILISPEMLASKSFEKLIKSKIFQDRLFAVGIDEVHLLLSWGGEFRPAFQQIAYMRARFKSSVVLFAMTATLLAGKHLQSLSKVLGLRKDKYTLLRRSNARPDIQLIFRTLNATQASDRFSQLDWVLKTSGKILIFCSSIRYGFKLAVYLWSLNPTGTCNIRLFNSLHSTEYNRETLELLEASDTSLITIATDKLSVGVDIPDFSTVVIVNPTDLDDLWQKAGRVGRDSRLISNPQAIVYIPRNTMKVIKEGSAAVPDTARKKKGKKATTAEIADGLRDIVLARCHAAAIDALYNNPTTDTPCSSSCLTCISNISSSPITRACRCSGCHPEPTMETSTLQPSDSAKRKQPVLSVRITPKMRQDAKKEFIQLRETIWLAADEQYTCVIPEERFFPEYIMDLILDGMPTVLTTSALRPHVEENLVQHSGASEALIQPFIRRNQYLAPHSMTLLQLVWDLQLKFDVIREEMRLAINKAAKLRRDAKKTGAKVTESLPDNVTTEDVDEVENSDAEGSVDDSVSTHSNELEDGPVEEAQDKRPSGSGLVLVIGERKLRVR